MKKALKFFCFFCLIIVSMHIKCYADTLAIEAEDGTIYGGFAVQGSQLASGGSYIFAQNTTGDVRSEAELGDVEAEYKFTVQNEKNYSIYLRVMATNDGDSNWVTIDGTLFALHYGAIEPGTFEWRKVGMYRLSPGEHVLRLYCREAGACIDKIIVSSNMLFTPRGMSDVLPEEDESLYDNGKGDVLAPLPADAPPSEHPRVMVKKDEIGTIRTNLTHPQNISTYEKLKAVSAKEAVGNMKGYNLSLLEIIESKAFMYMIMGDQEMGLQAKNATMEYIKTISASTSYATDSSMRSCGQFVYITSCVYDWCYDLFTPEERLEYINTVEDIVTLNFEGGYPIVEDKGTAESVDSHRAENPILKDLLAFSIAVYDEKPFVYDNIVGLIYQNYIPWRNELYKSEYAFQGGDATYGTFRIYFESVCTWLLDKIGQPNAFIDQQQYMTYKFVYFRRPDGGYLMDGDHHAPVFTNKFQYNDNAVHFLLGNYYKDSYLKWRYFKDRPLTDYTNQSLIGLSPAMYLLCNDVNVNIDNRRALPLTKYFGSPLGAMVARTSWEEGANSPAAIAVMKLYENYYAGHMHREVGSFQLYHKGILALDAGTYESMPYRDKDGNYVSGSPWGSAHYMGYLSAPIAHNCLLIYDPKDVSSISQGGQWMQNGALSALTTFEAYKAGSNKTGEIIGYDYGPDMHEPEYSYIEGDISHAYLKNKVKAYTRSFVFLNLFDDETPAALIVFDRMESTDKNLKKVWTLHSQEEPEINGNQVVVKRTTEHNNGRLINQTLLPQKSCIEKIGGEGYEFWNGKENLYVETYEEGRENGAWRVEISPDEKSEKDYFLNVMQVSDNNDAITPLACEMSEQGEFVGVYIKDRAVFMKKDAGKVYKNFTVSVPGEGECSYVITNLSEGIWNVFDETGEQVASESVSEENGVLHFRAQRGTYSIKWKYAAKIEKKNYGLLENSKRLDYQPVEVYFNNHYDGKAFLNDETVMIEAKDAARLFEINYEIYENGCSFTTATDKMDFYANHSEATLNGKTIQLTSAAVLRDGQLYVPIEALHNIVKFTDEYDPLTYILHIKYSFYVEGAHPDIVNSSDPERAKIINVTCSGINAAGNEPYKSLDNDFQTYWCVGGRDGWICYELSQSETITSVGLAWSSGRMREERFDILVSEDGNTWSEVFSGMSNGKTDRIEQFTLKKPMKAKYVKLATHGNTVNEMNSLLEAQIFCKKQ